LSRTFELKKIPLWPVVKLTFIIFLVIGILIALIYSIVLSGISYMAGTLGDPALREGFPMIRNFGFVMIPIVAITYAVLGTIGIIVWVLIYNLLATIVGGVELTLEPKGEPVRQQPRIRQDASETGHVPERPIDGF